MNWKQISKNCLSTQDGYLVSKYAMQVGSAYVSRAPGGKILHTGNALDRAKAACADHFKGACA